MPNSTQGSDTLSSVVFQAMEVQNLKKPLLFELVELQYSRSLKPVKKTLLLVLLELQHSKSLKPVKKTLLFELGEDYQAFMEICQ